MAAREQWLRVRRIRQIRAAFHAQVSGSASGANAAGTSCSAECTTSPGLGALLRIFFSAREVRVEERSQKLRGDSPSDLTGTSGGLLAFIDKELRRMGPRMG